MCTYNTNPKSKHSSIRCQSSRFSQGCSPYKESNSRRDLCLPYAFPSEGLISHTSQDPVKATKLKTLSLSWFLAHLILPTSPHRNTINISLKFDNDSKTQSCTVLMKLKSQRTHWWTAYDLSHKHPYPDGSGITLENISEDASPTP